MIAVDLQQGEQTPKKVDRDLGMLENVAELLGFGGLLRWATTRPDIAKYARNVKQADIYINPPLPDQDATSFGNRNSARMIEIGEQEARKQWEKLTSNIFSARR